MRVLRAPALHFLVSGALLFALTRAWPEPVEPLVVDAGLDPAAIDEALLLREAYARGMAQSDPVVRARLARNARFLGEGAPGADDAELADVVRSLGLERGDLVVRRRLVERMRAELEAEAAPPSEAEIRARIERDAGRYRSADRVRIAHTPTKAGARPVELAPRSERELAAEFGEDFARAVFALPLETWSEPIESAYGEHRVFVKERIRGALPSETLLRSRVEAELREERERAALRAGLERLRARQPIRVAERAP